MRSAVVIGSGHNGLVGATLLADAGWDVLVLEATDRIGGAVFCDRSLHPDFVTDWYSAFYPLGAASPVLNALDLGAHGLSWTHAPTVLAHVFPDDRCAVLSRDLDVTAASWTSSPAVTARYGGCCTGSSSGSASRYWTCCCARSRQCAQGCGWPAHWGRQTSCDLFVSRRCLRVAPATSCSPATQRRCCSRGTRCTPT